VYFRVIDVGSEWRTFSNEKANADPSRVGGPENPLLNGSDLTTMIGGGKGDAAFDEFGGAKYANRRTLSSADRALMNAFREIGQMAERINLPRTIIDRANNLFKVNGKVKLVMIVLHQKFKQPILAFSNIIDGS